MRAANKTLPPILRALSASSAGGVVLMVCAAIALGWANSPWAHGYFRLWETALSIKLETLTVSASMHWIINDGLMAVFFFLVGLEIKRELLVGELATARKAALPVAAALGGMIVPALLYFAFNARGAGEPGWGIPMATDIAFALGVLALVGDRIPSSLRVFLSALAIADDLGAVLVIALFYTSAISWSALAAAAALLILSFIANRTGVRAVWVYVAIGIALWIAMLLSGVDATVAGVLLAFTIPARPRKGETESLVVRFERDLRVPVTFGILPLFALANAGVSFAGTGDILMTPVALGVIAGLLLGKPIGISLAIYSTERIGIASIPDDVTRRMLFGAAVLGGIGFTMSLFISGLAFRQSPDMLTAAKLGTFAASVLAGIAGWLVLRRAPGAGDEHDILAGPSALDADRPASLA